MKFLDRLFGRIREEPVEDCHRVTKLQAICKGLVSVQEGGMKSTSSIGPPSWLMRVGDVN